MSNLSIYLVSTHLFNCI